MNRSGGLSYENRLLTLLFFTFGMVFFDRLALNIMFPHIAAEFGLQQRHLGMLAAGLGLTWALSGFIVGAWSDRLGKRKPLLIATILVFSLASMFSGFALGFVSLLACRVIMGIAEGPVLPLSQSLMVASSSTSRRGMNMGMLQSSAAGFMGSLIGPPILIWLAENVGWRSAFYVSCIPGLILAVLIWRQVREPTAAELAAAQTTHEREPEGGHGLLSLLRYRNIWLCVVISCFFVTWFIVIVTFAPTYFALFKGFALRDQTLVLTAIGVGHVFWGTAVPALSDRIGRRPAMTVFTFLSVLAPLAMITVQSPLALALIVIATYCGLGCFVLFMATIPAETVPAGYLATALGMVMGIGELVGGVIAPAIAGQAADTIGPTAPFWIAAAGAAVAGVLSCFLIETAPVKVRQQLAAGTA